MIRGHLTLRSFDLVVCENGGRMTRAAFSVLGMDEVEFFVSHPFRRMREKDGAPGASRICVLGEGAAWQG